MVDLEMGFGEERELKTEEYRGESGIVGRCTRGRRGEEM